MNKLTLIATAALLANVGYDVAQADIPSDARSVIVRYADLDTSRVDGAAKLFRRIDTAAAEVCKDLEPGKDLARIQPYADCMHRAISNAVAKIDLPAVTAYAVAHGVPMGDLGVQIASNH